MQLPLARDLRRVLAALRRSRSDERAPAAPAPAQGALWPGLLVIAALVAGAMTAGALTPLASPLLWALLLGVMAAPVAGSRAAAAPGVQFSSGVLLRWGVALIGLRVSAGDIAAVGLEGVVLVVGTVAVTMVSTIWLGRALGVAPKLGLLIATGTAICGASAIVATNSAIRARREDVAYAMATITFFGSVAMLALPELGSLLGLSEDERGMWIGASVHEVAQVAVSGAAVSATALALATLVKLARVVMLAPTVALVALAVRGEANAGPRLPGFVLVFLAFVALRSVVALPDPILDAAVATSTCLLAAGLASVGLGIRVGPLREAGIRPFVLGLAASGVAGASALGLTLATM